MKARLVLASGATASALVGAIAVAGCGGAPMSAIVCDADALAEGRCPSNGDAASADVAVAPDSGSPTADAAVDATALEGGGDATALDASSEPDAETDGGTEASGPSADPCPTASGSIHLLHDCDPACCSADPSCAAWGAGSCASATCGAGPELMPLNESFYVRTPDHPGVDAKCAANCPSAGFVYGLGFKVNLSVSGYYRLLVGVGDPWVILPLSPTPYCPATPSHAQTGCDALFVSNGDTIYIMTTDPNAPARNITLEFPTDQQATCPI
jgi:hypothetical protein